jgi:ribosomal protein L37AE/L43A
MGNITVKMCPNCGSHSMFQIAAGMTNTWKCKDCGFTGPAFEKELIQSEEGENSLENEK